MITVRYESPFCFLTQPFEIGVRHLKVAFCNYSQENLTTMARERIIYRALEANNNQFQPLTRKQRIYHAIVGLGETVGYLGVVVPFVIAAIDNYFNKPATPRENLLSDHIDEGGIDNIGFQLLNCRKNPFTDDNILFDNFYAGASWITSELRSRHASQTLRYLVAAHMAPLERNLAELDQQRQAFEARGNQLFD